MPTQFVDCNKANTLPFTEILELLRAKREDSSRRDQLQDEYEAANPRQEADAEGFEVHSNLSTGSSDDLPADVCGNDDGAFDWISRWENGDYIGTEGDQCQSDEEDDEEDEWSPSPTQPLAIMSYRLDVVDEIGDPEDLFEEIRLIEQ